jgi:uncharacterized protein (TIGR01319 family)
VQGVLLIDIGSTYTKVTAVDVDGQRIVGTSKAFTTVDTDINEGLENALELLHSRTGKIRYISKLACSSAAGGLKMVAVGLVPDLTAEAAKRAALSAGAKVLKAYSYELNDMELEDIQSLKPDILLLCGGTDGGNKRVILHNAQVIAQIKGEFPVIVAGNKSVTASVEDILLKSGKEVRVCGNVMPDLNTLNIEPAREAIREIFLKRIIRAKGLTGVKELVEGILMPTPSAVLKGACLLSAGCAGEQGLGDIMVVDIGGATADVYSIAKGDPTGAGVILKGLPEPFAKRTVEGDLGVRYNANSLMEVAGIKNIVEKSGLSPDEVLDGINIIEEDPSVIPSHSNNIASLDLGLSAMAVRIATQRHVGRLETVYTPFGPSFVQTGKDLSKVSYVIGTGGPIINSINPGFVLKEALFDGNCPEILKPKGAKLFVDSQYIFAAMGLLSEKYPTIALNIMKKELELIPWK